MISENPFFSPRGVAVIGASSEPTRLGYGIARSLVTGGYPGQVVLVNPKGGQLLGHPLYPSILQVPDPVDLAVLLVPAAAAPETLRQCGERGLKAVILCSGGFSETGTEGAALESQCAEIARQYHMRLMGPNCIGVIDTHLPMNATFLPPPGPLPGNVAFISHSGALCAAVIDWSRSQGMGFSRLVSLGNQADLSEAEVLEPVAEDPHTLALTLYLESVRDGRQFVRQAATAARRKPLVAVKVGRYSSGQRAAASHTGALAGQESAYDAAFRRAGVIRADTIEEMFEWARALAACPLPQGRRIAVLTNAGGPGVTAADALEAQGLQLADLSDSTLAAMRQFLPPAASLRNPVDMLASASPEDYARSLQLLLSDAGVDGAMVIIPAPPMFAAGAVARAIIPVIQSGSKPVVAAVMGGDLVSEAVAHLRAAGVPEYRFPERAAAALAALAQRSTFLAQDSAELRPLLQPPVGLCGSLPDGVLAPEASSCLLEAYGIRTTQSRLAASAEEAVTLARSIGMGEDQGVVLKIASPDIQHKSDVGGVLLNLKDDAAVAQGFSNLMANARAARPEARLEGVSIQPLIGPGQDVIIGGIRDPQFGPLVMFGSGGVEVEGLKDIAFALAPLTEPDLDYLLAQTWAGRRLKGFRNLPPADETAVRQALTRLAQLMADSPDLAEIEINPLRVLPGKRGAIALDVRGRTEKTG
jgi:acetyltransferase